MTVPEWKKLVEEIVENIDADWWNDGQTPYEQGVKQKKYTRTAITASVVELLEELKKEQFWTRNDAYDVEDVVAVTAIDELIKEVRE